MKKLTKQKKIEGSIFAIPLIDNKFAYGLVCKGGDMCFFNYITQNSMLPERLQESTPLFRVCVNDSAPKEGEWIFVGNVKLVGVYSEYSFYYNKPVGSDEIYLYSMERDTLSLSDEREAAELEVFGSWFAKNISDRILNTINASS